MTALDEIRGRWQAATPGPWYQGRETDRYENIREVYNEREQSATSHDICTAVWSDTDAEFIAHAPTDVARLLAAVEGVLDLHQPEQCTNDDGFLIDLYTCSECKTSEDGGLVPVLDPCPTVKAITAALEAS